MEAVLTKVTLPLKVVQDLVVKVSKGSTMIDVIPVSCLIQLKVRDNILSVRTTDNSTHVLGMANVDCPDFELCVNTTKFTALISKLSCENVTFISDGNKLTIQGNGVYNIPLDAQVNEQVGVLFGDVIFDCVTSKHLSTSEFSTIDTLNKTCKSNTKEVPCLYNYYFDSKGTLTTNTFKACYNPLVVSEVPVLLSPSLIDLAKTCTVNDYGIDIGQNESQVMFYSEDVRSGIKYYVIGKKCSQADLNAYPHQQLTELMSTTPNSYREINRSDLLGAAERIGLFTEKLDKTRINVTFSQDSLTIKEVKSQSVEIVNFVDKPSTDAQEVSMDISCDDLVYALSTFPERLQITPLEVGVHLYTNNVKVVLCVVGED